MNTYDLQAAAYWRYVKSHPTMGVTNIHDHFAGGKYGMRKSDSLDLIGKLKDAADFRTATRESKIRPNTKNKMIGQIFRSAKRQSQAAQRRKPDKPGVKPRSIKQTFKDTFGEADHPNDFSERYS